MRMQATGIQTPTAAVLHQRVILQSDYINAQRQHFPRTPSQPATICVLSELTRTMCVSKHVLQEAQV